MILDLQSFGHGLGLVMVGWVAGMVVGVVFNTFRSVRNL